MKYPILDWVANSMIRKQIYITTEQEAALKQLSRATRQSESELVRQALASHLHALDTVESRLRAWQEERAFIENLPSNVSDTATRTWTRDGLYDR
ncbi:MAG: hypothetical protein QOH93_889 [Chloroflexia bacterium]|jgi:predicted transcriptional regulator|nr:hypothetical protein [Chloroflexia bacterium]